MHTAATLPTPSPAELRRFGLILTTGIVVLFGLFFPWLAGRPLPLWPWLTGLTCLAAGLVVPRILGPVYRGWMRLGAVLGWINTRIILALLFYVMILPAGACMRLFGRDPMARRFEPTRDSYRIPSHKSRPNDWRGPSDMLDLINDLWAFMRVRKKFWLAPIMMMLLLLGGLLVLSQGSAIAPFIYTLF